MDEMKKYRFHGLKGHSLGLCRGWPYVFLDSISNPAFRNTSLTLGSTTENSPPNPRLAINTPSHPVAREGRAKRTDSRVRRFKRFLPTARLSTLVGTTNANRLTSVDPSRFLYIRDTPSPLIRLPIHITDLMSGEGSRFSRGTINSYAAKNSSLSIWASRRSALRVPFFTSFRCIGTTAR